MSIFGIPEIPGEGHCFAERHVRLPSLDANMAKNRLQYLTANDWALIMAKAKRLTFSLGQEIIKQGVHGDTIDVIRSGEASVELTGTESTTIVGWLEPEDVCEKNKRFTPNVLAVTVGTEIEFLNQDPFFHDVFSIYHGKPLDLGLYESGTSRKVLFTQPGVSYIFCNIHPEISAAVTVLRTPHFAITGMDGSFRISHLTPGQYKVGVRCEFVSESELAALRRDLQITPGENALDTITVHSSDRSQETSTSMENPTSRARRTNIRPRIMCNKTGRRLPT